MPRDLSLEFVSIFEFRVYETFRFRLFPSSRDFGVEFELALAFGAFRILIRFFLAELYLCAEAVRAFEVGKNFLDVTPLGTFQFHDLLRTREIALA